VRGRGFNFFLAVKKMLECGKFTDTYLPTCPACVPSLRLVTFCLAEKKMFQKFSKYMFVIFFLKKFIMKTHSKIVLEDVFIVPICSPNFKEAS
jgi:hypothetical protein